jgi:DNA-binding NarL/FixJ family response regulator
MRILFIEDHPLKQAQINRFIEEKFVNCQVEVRNSYISGLKELKGNYNNYDVLLLDISMPNYDISSDAYSGDIDPLFRDIDPPAIGQ